MATRVRRHANPFNCHTEVGRLDRDALFGRLAPLEVELGPGSARFLFERARANPDTDFVGFEVRRPLVESAMVRRQREGPPNVAVLYANATDNLAIAEPGIIRRFHVHFPDPWAKKRHWKRRMVQPGVVRAMAELLPIGGQIYAQSDVANLAAEMYAFFSADGALKSLLDPTMRVDRPFVEQTDWERHHEEAGEPVYRMLFEKRREVSGPVPELTLRPTGPLGPAT